MPTVSWHLLPKLLIQNIIRIYQNRQRTIKNDDCARSLWRPLSCSAPVHSQFKNENCEHQPTTGKPMFTSCAKPTGSQICAANSLTHFHRRKACSPVPVPFIPSWRTILAPSEPSSLRCLSSSSQYHPPTIQSLSLVIRLNGMRPQVL